MYNGRIELEIKRTKNCRQCLVARMPKTLEPQLDRRGGAEGELRRQLHRVEIAGALTLELHLTSWKILDREAMRVKFNRNIIITCEFANRNQILD